MSCCKNKSEYIVAIPARYASTRFPGKPLVLVGGIPMIKRVCMQALKSDAKMVVACIDDERVESVLEGMDKVRVCMTSTDCNCGTDRLAQMIEKMQIDPETIIVNVQGDEPLINPEHIKQVATLLESSKADMSTLCFKIDNVKDVFDPNCVKVVFDKTVKHCSLVVLLFHTSVRTLSKKILLLFALITTITSEFTPIKQVLF